MPSINNEVRNGTAPDHDTLISNAQRTRVNGNLLMAAGLTLVGAIPIAMTVRSNNMLRHEAIQDAHATQTAEPNATLAPGPMATIFTYNAVSTARVEALRRLNRDGEAYRSALEDVQATAVAKNLGTEEAASKATMSAPPRGH